jgi:hypothetical protein
MLYVIESLVELVRESLGRNPFYFQASMTTICGMSTPQIDHITLRQAVFPATFAEGRNIELQCASHVEAKSE